MAYVVVENTPGYLPESEAEEFSNFKDAASYAASLAREHRELGNKTSKFSGKGWIEYQVEDGSLGRVITVERSFE